MQRFEAMELPVIDSFDGEFSFLSNKFESEIEVYGVTFSSVEDAYNTISQRVDSREVYLRQLVEKKFAKGTVLATRLINTGDAVLISDDKDNLLGDLLVQQRIKLKFR